MHRGAASFNLTQHEQVKAFDLVTRPRRFAQKLQAGRHAGLALKAANRDALTQLIPTVMFKQSSDDGLQRRPMKRIGGLLGHHDCRALFFTSRGRGSGSAGPQAQRPLVGQRSTRSDKRGGLLFILQLAPKRHLSDDGGAYCVRRHGFWWGGVFFWFFDHLAAVLLTFCHGVLLWVT